MEIEHISDTHGFHEQIKLKGADVLVHTGDCTNYHDQYRNHHEFHKFIKWFERVSKNYSLTIFIPGNHDSFIFHNEKEVRKLMESMGIEFLHKKSITFQGLNFYGDSTCPRFGDWYYMTDRRKTNRHWEQIPFNTNVLLTHTPPKGILDLAENRKHNVELCGDSALLKTIKKLPDLQCHMFGHIHNNHDIENNGILKRDGIYFSNASLVVDGQFDKGIQNRSNIIQL